MNLAMTLTGGLILLANYRVIVPLITAYALVGWPQLRERRDALRAPLAQAIRRAQCWARALLSSGAARPRPLPARVECRRALLLRPPLV